MAFNTGAINQRIKITGSGLYALSGVEVSGAGFIDFSYFDSSPEYIEFLVPENITYGNINFYFITGSSVSDPLFKSGVSFYPIPRLDSIFPATQDVNNFVVISGKSLTGVDTVWFNNISGTSVVYDQNSGGLVVRVPSGYTTGPIRVSGYNNSGIVGASSPFYFYGRMSLTGFSPNIAYEGDLISISGQNFNLSYVNGAAFPVTFNGPRAGLYVTGLFTGSNNLISGLVPSGATSGYVSIFSIDNTNFISNSPLYVIKTPSVTRAFKFYAESGESNILVGKNFNFVTGIVFSGYNYRAPKPILNNNIYSIPSGKFGNCLYIPQTGGLLISNTYSGDFSFGTNDFTIEFWINPFPYLAASRIDLISNDPMSSPRQAGFQFFSEAGSTNWTFSVTGNTILTIPNSNIPANQWNKVAISRRGTTTIGIVTGSAGGFSTTSTFNYRISSTGGLGIGQSLSGAATSYSGLIDDIRISNSTGLYDSLTLPQIINPLFDTANTKLLIHGNYSNLDFTGNRNSISSIPTISGWIRDYNYAALQNVYQVRSFSVNSQGSAISFTGSGIPQGIYDVIIYNTGSRPFIFQNNLVVKGPPVLLEMSSTEGYMGQQIEIFGQNLYPNTQIFFQDTGVSGSYIESSEDLSSYLVSSTFRNRNTFSYSGILINSGSRFDDRSIFFSGNQAPYISTQINNSILATGSDFTIELDFRQSPGFTQTSNKYLFYSDSISAYVSSGYVIVSGFKFVNGSTSLASGNIANATGWHHLSISKTIYSKGNVTGDILLDGSGVYSFNNDFSLSTGGAILFGSTTGLNPFYSWSGNIDEIRISSTNRYLNNKNIPIKRFKNDNKTQLLIHSSFGLLDDNINDFEYIKINVPNLSAYRKTYISANNNSGTYIGNNNQIFTFLNPPQLTGLLTRTGIQGQTFTGLGTDIYYVNSIFVGNYQVTGYSIINSGSEFNQSISFTVPDFAQNNDVLTINSPYYVYNHPSGLTIASGILQIDGFYPPSVKAEDFVTISGKFLNKVNKVRLGNQSAAYYDITTFVERDISHLLIQIPKLYDFVDGPITLFGNDGSSATSTQSLTFSNPIIYSIRPASAYWNDTIIFSGVNLSGLDFGVSGANNDIVKFTGVAYVGNTGVSLKVPREIVRSNILFFYSGTNSGIAGNTRYFEATPTISGVNATGYRSRDSILITGVNLYNNTARTLYISGYNYLTETTGQFLLSSNLILFDASQITGSTISQPYTGQSVYSGIIALNGFSDYSPYYNTLVVASYPVGAGYTSSGVGIGTMITGGKYLIDGFVGSGRVFFQRNSFDADNLYQTITVKVPQITVSGLDRMMSTGNQLTVISLSGNNLNYVTGIKFTGFGRLAAQISGGGIAEFALNYRTGVVAYTNVKSVNNSLYYKDPNIIKFYPPSMSGKGVHGHDVEDVRPITGQFILMTYFNEEIPVSGTFFYEPTISIIDAYLNNNLTYISDGTAQVSGFDGSIISFSGQGVKNLSNVEFFSSNSGVIIEKYGTTFHTVKRKPTFAFLNAVGGSVTGYVILDYGAGYTTNPTFSADTSLGIGVTAPNGNGIVSFTPPYVGMVTGLNIITNASSNTLNAWSGTNIFWDNPSSKFITQTPLRLTFTGNNWVAQSGSGFFWAGFCTSSTTFPTGNDFVVTEQLDFKLYNPVGSFTTQGKPFLVIQDPKNIHRVADVVLTGASYVGLKNKLVFRYSDFFGAGFEFTNEPVLKTSVIYPTGYTKNLLVYQIDSTSIGQKNFTVNFSSPIPDPTTYVITSTPEPNRYLRLRIEASDPNSSFYKGLGSSQLNTVNLIGRAGIGTTVGYGTAGPAP